MSDPTPTPERVTLSDEEREAVVAANHCTPDGKIMEALVPVIERILAAREQALREEIAAAREALARVEALAERYESDAASEGYGGELWSTTAASIGAALRGETR